MESRYLVPIDAKLQVVSNSNMFFSGQVLVRGTPITLCVINRGKSDTGNVDIGIEEPEWLSHKTFNIANIKGEDRECRVVTLIPYACEQYQNCRLSASVADEHEIIVTTGCENCAPKNDQFKIKFSVSEPLQD